MSYQKLFKIYFIIIAFMLQFSIINDSLIILVKKFNSLLLVFTWRYQWSPFLPECLLKAVILPLLTLFSCIRISAFLISFWMLHLSSLFTSLTFLFSLSRPFFSCLSIFECFVVFSLSNCSVSCHLFCFRKWLFYFQSVQKAQ